MTITHLMKGTARITLEHEDGTVFTGLVYVTEVRFHPRILEFSTFDQRGWSMSVQGVKGLKVTQCHRDVHIEEVVKPARTAREWKCDRCGTVWPREDNQCGACGFWRPFIFEDPLYVGE